jgi:hypothetical protein
MSSYTGYGLARRGQGLPGGGSDGDVLTLDSNLNPGWEAPSGGGGGSGDVEFLESVTGYTGGGATKLDGTTTVGVSVPKLYAFEHATEGVLFYLLKAGTTAESSPNVIRPDDYNGAVNAKIFVAVL